MALLVFIKLVNTRSTNLTGSKESDDNVSFKEKVHFEVNH